MSITKMFQGVRAKQAKRVGRGISAGGGKTAGRGTKGQHSRTGGNRKVKAWFEGGQTPLYRKMAKKRGFNHVVTEPIVLTSGFVAKHFSANEIVSPQTLLDKKLIRRADLKRPFKVIARGKLVKTIKFEGINLSKSLTK
jgi:large subunit ribosomal protein L15